jgi:hypothetical protein
MSTAEKCRQVAWDCLKLAEATSNPKTGASLLNLAQHWVPSAEEIERNSGYVAKADEWCFAGPEHRRSRATRGHAPVRGYVAKPNRTDQGRTPGRVRVCRPRGLRPNGHAIFALATAATALTLLLSASASVFAADGIAQDDVCTGSKPFREVAQDETRTMAELCRMQEEFLRGDRGWQDTPPYARGHGELPNGWAQSGNNIQMRKK